MKVYRLSRSKYKNDLEGAGAKLAGGRWNKIGTACVYTSESRSLAILEYAVNVELESIPKELVITVYEIPQEEFLVFEEPQLPKNWMEMPSPQLTKDFGSNFLEDPNILGIRIPSTVVPDEFNYIINPNSNKLSRVHIIEAKDFVFDIRIKS